MKKKTFEDTDIVKDIQNKEFLVIFCEPLSTFCMNLMFCCERQDCYKFYGGSTPYKSEVMFQLFCSNCKSKEWILVGVKVDPKNKMKGQLSVVSCDPNYGEYITKLINRESSVDHL